MNIEVRTLYLFGGETMTFKAKEFILKRGNIYNIISRLLVAK